MLEVMRNNIWSLVLEEVEEPKVLFFRGAEKFIKRLHRAIVRRERIAIHCDVDVDGLGAGYIIGKFLEKVYGILPLYCINRERVHGLLEGYAKYTKEIDLLIVVDSSSNDTKVLESMQCDVLVIDHHHIEHDRFEGETLGGQYLIINNLVDNKEIAESAKQLRKINGKAAEQLEEYEADRNMSCGVVMYELLRLYAKFMGIEKTLEELRLEQWAGVTLFTDAISLNNRRNQWYIDKTVDRYELEYTLGILLEKLNGYKQYLDKTIILYSIAPVINKAIRAGKSLEVLNSLMRTPIRLMELKYCEEDQRQAVTQGLEGAREHGCYVERVVMSGEIKQSYNGVIANSLVDRYGKNAIVYQIENGIAKGSFRGRKEGINYRGIVSSLEYAEGRGHQGAFGFECEVEHIGEMMAKVEQGELGFDTRPKVVVGRLAQEVEGQYNIEDFGAFRKAGGLMELGRWNSRSSAAEQIKIRVDAREVRLRETRGKLYLYEAYGMQWKAFREIEEGEVDLYIEFGREIELYIK